jgi:polyisoprenyl-phosphate glycosyltransferase
MSPIYSFIVPVYNEEEIIPELFSRIKFIMDGLEDEAELILVNDGSKDSSISKISELKRQDERVSYLSLARNFGHQVAVTAGLNYARGKAVIILDADLQDPPEVIPEMIKKWKEGYQVVYAQRTARHQEGKVKRFTAYLFYRLLKRLADVDIPTDAGDFCLIDRKVIDVLNSMPENNRYLRGLRAWVGFNQTAIRYERDPRYAGQVKYTFRKSLSLAMNGIFSFSKIPLRFSTYLGFISAVAAILMALSVLYWRIFQPASPVTGYATIMIVVFFIGAVQLISVGILGEYIGRIYEEVKRRPLYTLDEVAGFGLEKGKLSVINYPAIEFKKTKCDV